MKSNILNDMAEELTSNQMKKIQKVLLTRLVDKKKEKEVFTTLIILKCIYRRSLLKVVCRE